MANDKLLREMDKFIDKNYYKYIGDVQATRAIENTEAYKFAKSLDSIPEKSAVQIFENYKKVQAGTIEAVAKKKKNTKLAYARKRLWVTEGRRRRSYNLEKYWKHIIAREEYREEMGDEPSGYSGWRGIYADTPFHSIPFDNPAEVTEDLINDGDSEQRQLGHIREYYGE